MGDKIIAIVGARLNSSRLPGKHLLPLAGKPLIERLWQRLARVDAISTIILATTSDDYNAPLREWAVSSGKICLDFDGDVDDLVGRVDAAVKIHDPDIIVYICGDSPLIEPATLDRMIAAIKDKPEIESVLLKSGTDGHKNIHEGFDIFRRSFWDRMCGASVEPFEREHVGAIYHHLGKVTPFGSVHVTEPAIYSSIDHRISVDTPSDYRFMDKLYQAWYAENAADTIVDLTHVIERLKAEPSLKNMNKHVYQKSLKDTSLKVAIFTEASPENGMGHLMRTLSVTAALQDYLGAQVTLLIKGIKIQMPELALVSHVWVDTLGGAQAKLALEENALHIVDMKDATGFIESRNKVACPESRVVAVDIDASYIPFVDLAWLASFYVDEATKKMSNIRYGWDCFLLRDTAVWSPRAKASSRKILVLSGGSDAAGMGKTLPANLLEELPEDVHIDWVQGPYAEPPVAGGEEANIKRLSVIKAPARLPDLFADYDAVLCAYGVSFFECLRSGVPTIVFDPVGAAGSAEWAALEQQFPKTVKANSAAAIEQLKELLSQKEDISAVPEIVSLLQQGPEHFAREIAKLIAPSSPVIAEAAYAIGE